RELRHLAATLAAVSRRRNVAATIAASDGDRPRVAREPPSRRRPRADRRGERRDAHRDGPRGGENVYPREIEETLLAHPAVAEAAVVGAPDPLYGEVVWAFLAPRPGARLDEGQVLAWCATRLADFKRPVRIT